MTPYMFGYGVIPKKLNFYTTHHPISLKITAGGEPAPLLLSRKYECW